jgi:hypothetical protein
VHSWAEHSVRLIKGYVASFHELPRESVFSETYFLLRAKVVFSAAWGWRSHCGRAAPRLANSTAEQPRLRVQYEPVLRVHLKAAGLTELYVRTSTRRKLRPRRRRPRIANLKDLVSGRRGSEQRNNDHTNDHPARGLSG